MIGAISGSNTNWPVTLELQEALRLPTPRPTFEFAKRSHELEGYLKGLENFPVPNQLSVEEAAAMFELWGQHEAIHSCAFFSYFYTFVSG